MNILHISAQKPDSTGSGVYLRETVAALDRQGHSQAVIAGIAPEDSPVFPDGVLFRPVRFETEKLPFPVAGMSDVMPYKATRYRDMTPPMVAQFKAAFRAAIDDVAAQFVPDIVICHHLYLVCAVAVKRFAEIAATNDAFASCTVCGLSHSTDIRQMRQIPLERDFIRQGVQQLDRIYSLHSAQAKEIVETYDVPADRIRIVGTGYDAGMFFERPGLRSENAHRIVYVGKICRKKGVESLVRAFHAVVGEIPDARLMLVGGYNDQQEYDEIFELASSLELPVEFAGRLSDGCLVEAYCEANVFVLPSFFEGLPLVSIEALACGCKAVLTDLPGISPWVQSYVEGGYIDFVEPPRMLNVDTPIEADLPAFEKRLAEALIQALRAPYTRCDTSRISWDALAKRLL